MAKKFYPYSDEYKVGINSKIKGTIDRQKIRGIITRHHLGNGQIVKVDRETGLFKDKQGQTRFVGHYAPHAMQPVQRSWRRYGEICEDCGSIAGRMVDCPYTKDIEDGKIKRVCLCIDCESERARDI